MRKTRLLDALLPKTRQGILAAMFVPAGKPWYVSELARRIGVPSSSLQRELAALTLVGLLKHSRQGHMAYYQANTSSPVFTELRGLLLKTVGLVDVLADALEPVSAKLRVAFVYGSIASNEDTSESDIDVMVVGKVAPADLALPLRRARELLGREINPMVYTPAEFDHKRATKDHFLTQVLTKPRLLVVGTEDDLGKAAG